MGIHSTKTRPSSTYSSGTGRLTDIFLRQSQFLVEARSPPLLSAQNLSPALHRTPHLRPMLTVPPAIQATHRRPQFRLSLPVPSAIHIHCRTTADGIDADEGTPAVNSASSDLHIAEIFEPLVARCPELSSLVYIIISLLFLVVYERLSSYQTSWHHPSNGPNACILTLAKQLFSCDVGRGGVFK